MLIEDRLFGHPTDAVERLWPRDGTPPIAARLGEHDAATGNLDSQSVFEFDGGTADSAEEENQSLHSAIRRGRGPTWGHHDTSAACESQHRSNKEQAPPAIVFSGKAGAGVSRRAWLESNRRQDKSGGQTDTGR